MNQDLLTLVQWLSPAFPVGGFAYSHGLEQVIAAGAVTSARGLQDWLTDILRFGGGRSDAILLAQALRPDADIPELSALARALAPSRERLAETLDQGAAFIATTNALRGAGWPVMPYPVAVGAVARDLDLAPGTVVSLYLHSFASNLVQGAVRFIPLGQTEGQAALSALHPAIAQTVEEACAVGLDALGTASLHGDIAAMLHETMEVRIFRT